MHQQLRKGSSLPPLAKRHNSYIERTMHLLDSGCQQSDRLTIDGYYGDYRMRLFRLKDKNAYSKNINSVFTNTFTKSIMPADDTDVQQQIEEIIHSERHKQQYLREKNERQNKKNEPIFNKGNMVSTMEEDQHLLYAYIPQYQRNRWFQLKDSSRRQIQTLQPKSESNIKKKLSLRRKKNKYMFAYLQKAYSQRQQ